jgi:hypothetical protein
MAAAVWISEVTLSLALREDETAGSFWGRPFSFWVSLAKAPLSARSCTGLVDERRDVWTQGPRRRSGPPDLPHRAWARTRSDLSSPIVALDRPAPAGARSPTAPPQRLGDLEQAGRYRPVDPSAAPGAWTTGRPPPSICGSVGSHEACHRHRGPKPYGPATPTFCVPADAEPASLPPLHLPKQFQQIARCGRGSTPE